MITSTSNGKVKYLVNLRKKKKLRDGEGLFLTEGIRMFKEVPADRLKEVYMSDSFYKKTGGKGAGVFWVSPPCSEWVRKEPSMPMRSQLPLA